MTPASIFRHPARPAFGRAFAFLLGLLAAAGCGRYVPGTIASSTRVTTGAAWDGDVAISPDGSHCVFVSERADGHRGLWLRTARLDDNSDPIALATGAFDVSRPSWSKNGLAVRFTRTDSVGGAARVFEVNPRSPGAPQLLAVGPPAGAVTDAIASPDGAAWAMIVRGDSTSTLGTWSAAGGWHPLVDAGAGPPAHPTWSKKGEGVVYAQGGGLFWVAATGGMSLRLTGGAARETDPTLSPNGHWLAFVSDSTGVANVWLARFTLDKAGKPTLGAWRPATAGLTPFGHPAWEPSGQGLWFEARDPWVVASRAANLPGQGSAGGPAGPADTLSSSLFDSREPTYSGDGSHVAFASTRAGGWHVFAMSAAGEASSGPAKQLTSGPDGDRAPRWSRASGQVAYVHAGSTLALTDPTGAVLGSVATGSMPAWSPDGRSLAFVRADSAAALWLLEGVGRTLRALPAAGRGASDPTWGTGSLEGAIVFAAAVGVHVSLWQAPMAGGAARELTGDTFPGSTDREPAVSPDGRSICFTRQRRGDRDLWIYDGVTGRARTLVTNPRGQEGHAEWSPDGRRIVYETGGAVNLYRADVRPLLLR